VSEMFKSILEGEKLPSRIINGREPGAEEIPNIRGATIHGLVEISRGCGCRSGAEGDIAPFRGSPALWVQKDSTR